MKVPFSYYENHQDNISFNLINYHSHEATDYPSHFHRKMEATYVVEDSVHSVINNQVFVAEKDEILFVPNYYSHSYRAGDKSVRMVILPAHEFSCDLRTVLSEKTLPCLLNDKKYNREVIYPILLELLEVKKSGSLLTKKGYLNIIFGRLLEHYPTVSINTNKQIETLLKILTYIDNHFSEELSLEKLSSEFGYSKYHFSKLFNNYIGDSVTNYINTIRINRFVELYQNTNDTNITKLAYSVGFNSMPSFYRFFNKQYNCNPKDYLSKLK